MEAVLLTLGLWFVVSVPMLAYSYIVGEVRECLEALGFGFGLMLYIGIVIDVVIAYAPQG